MKPIVFVLVLAISLTGCGDARRDRWYEESNQLQKREEEYVQFQVQHAGMSEAEAKRQFGLILAIEKTQGREPVEITREELQERIGSPP